MTDIIGYHGIRAHKTNGVVTITFDSDVRTDIEYVRDFRKYLGITDGRRAGETLQDLMEEMVSIKSQLAENQYYRENNPAVSAAWEHYQTMLGLAKEDKDIGT
jgi:hypothetical protein